MIGVIRLFLQSKDYLINATPIKEWNDQDKAFLNVVDGIKVLSAKTLRELKEAEFELDEFQKLFPPTFEISELTHFKAKHLL